MRKKSSFRVLRVGYLCLLMLGVLSLLFSSLFSPLTTQAQATSTGSHVDVATFKLPITPVTAQYYNRLIDTAEQDGAQALVVTLDTPGGLVESMQGMVQRTLASRVPVIVYVGPQGAMATSAGVFIVYSSQLAAMAPNTTI